MLFSFIVTYYVHLVGIKEVIKEVIDIIVFCTRRLSAFSAVGTSDYKAFVLENIVVQTTAMHENRCAYLTGIFLWEEGIVEIQRGP